MIKAELVKEYEKLESSLINAIGELVAFPSILEENSKDTPFGEDIDKCLDKALEMCQNLGFKVFKDPKGYYGYAETGSGEEMIAVLGHLDVVPAGDLSKWDSEPFTMIKKDGKIFGRGTQDDKGPTLTAIYAVKALMNLNVKFSKRVRFIFGTDEENLWRCINRYMEIEEKPSMGFTPDSKFPMIYAEKGLLQFTLEGKGGGVTLKGGEAYNAVPDKIEYTSVSDEELQNIVKELEKANSKFEVSENKITVYGKSVHAASGENGINAIKKLMMAMKSAELKNIGIDFVTSEIGNDPYAEKIYGVLEDEVSGKLKFNVGKVDIDNEKTKLFIDVRIPVTVSKEEIVKKSKLIGEKYGMVYEERDFLRSLYVPLDHFLIKTLRKVYEEETGFDSTPISSGGATYARSMDNCVAFGAVFPDSEKTEHQPNECLAIKDIERAFTIYGKAIYELAK
ncbi:MAG: Sapep family Mn(2+)-dependent dipeptidase [Fusobacteriaceae bacterium]|nr:Sapep family Mn(2+)-dependent dipeptidase [Fusobacteriaceae bacterium]